MMKIIAKVIDDNGHKIELIRLVKDIPLRVGTTVEMAMVNNKVDLRQLFHGLIDADTQDAIFDKFNETKKNETKKKEEPEKKEPEKIKK